MHDLVWLRVAIPDSFTPHRGLSDFLRACGVTIVGHDRSGTFEGLGRITEGWLAEEPVEAVLPLSYGQRSLWFLHHLAPEGNAYNIAAAVRLPTTVDAGALERAFQALVNRHAALRTTFPEAGGEPTQRVLRALDLRLAREDATGWGEERLRSRLAEEAWRPFNLARGPLLRTTLWTGDPAGPVLLFVVHHIVADFWSLAILMRELPAMYSTVG